MLQQLAEHRPRSWQGWIARGQPAVRTVRTQLEADLCIRVGHRKILPDRVELLDRRAVKQRREHRQRLDELAVYTGPDRGRAR